MGREPLNLRGAFNFRDLGGYATRDGRRVRERQVYRADALHRLEEEDAAALEPLGIARIFDLRSDRELLQDGVGAFARAHGHVHVPLVAVTLSPFDPTIDWSRIDLQSRYAEMLRTGTDSIRTVLEALAAPGAAPVVFHCTGGKDRTGVVAALLLRTLGVDDADIVADYSVSEVHLRSRMEHYRTELLRMGMGADAIAYLTSSPPERMWHTLELLDAEWGGTLPYLASIGVTPQVVDMLRANLLD